MSATRTGSDDAYLQTISTTGTTDARLDRSRRSRWRLTPDGDLRRRHAGRSSGRPPRSPPTTRTTAPCSDSLAGCLDIYERDLTAGTTTLVSTGPLGGQPGYDASFAGATPDGSHVYFHAGRAARAGGHRRSPNTCRLPTMACRYNGCVDVYERFGGQTTLISTGPTKNASDPPSPLRRRHAGRRARVLHDAGAARRRRHGLRCATSMSVRAGPRSCSRTPRAPTLPRRSLPGGTSADARQVFLDTAERWLSADTDTQRDAYANSCGTLDLATTGPIGGNGSYSSTGRDGLGRRPACSSRPRNGSCPRIPTSAAEDIYQW